MVSAFWGAPLPTVPAVCNKHDYSCYVQSSMSKGYLCGYAIKTTYSSVTEDRIFISKQEKNRNIGL